MHASETDGPTAPSFAQGEHGKFWLAVFKHLAYCSSCAILYAVQADDSDGVQYVEIVGHQMWASLESRQMSHELRTLKGRTSAEFRRL